MSLLIYLAIALVTLFGVLFETNVFFEPRHKVEHASVAASRPAQSAAPRAAAAPATDARGEAAQGVAERTTTNQAIAAQQPQSKAVSAKCDVTACAAAYHTFRASDCTFEPARGERRLCAKGVVSDEAAAEAALTAHADAASAAAPAKCNVNACSRAYVSFSAADCTYQPTDGPRRLCAK
jgi:hypothetical protein